MSVNYRPGLINNFLAAPFFNGEPPLPISLDSIPQGTLPPDWRPSISEIPWPHVSSFREADVPIVVHSRVPGRASLQMSLGDAALPAEGDVGPIGNAEYSNDDTYPHSRWGPPQSHPISSLIVERCPLCVGLPGYCSPAHAAAAAASSLAFRPRGPLNRVVKVSEPSWSEQSHPNRAESAAPAVWHGKPVCPNRPVTNALGLNVGGYKIPLDCSRWDCPVCARRKADKLARNMRLGVMNLPEKNFGLFTWTLQANNPRRNSLPAAWWQETLATWWKRFRRRWQHKYGESPMFIKAVEVTKKGVPHVHAGIRLPPLDNGEEVVQYRNPRTGKVASFITHGDAPVSRPADACPCLSCFLKRDWQETFPDSWIVTVTPPGHYHKTENGMTLNPGTAASAARYVMKYVTKWAGDAHVPRRLPTGEVYDTPGLHRYSASNDWPRVRGRLLPQLLAFSVRTGERTIRDPWVRSRLYGRVAYWRNKARLAGQTAGENDSRSFVELAIALSALYIYDLDHMPLIGVALCAAPETPAEIPQEWAGRYVRNDGMIVNDFGLEVNPW